MTRALWPLLGAEVDWVVRQRARMSLSGKRGPRWKCGREMWPRRGRCTLAAITACYILATAHLRHVRACALAV